MFGFGIPENTRRIADANDIEVVLQAMGQHEQQAETQEKGFGTFSYSQPREPTSHCRCKKILEGGVQRPGCGGLQN